jgi:hypothetical protein
MSDNPLQTMPPTLECTTAASAQAAAHWQANLSALQSFQLDLASRFSSPPKPQPWVFARDGFLTTRIDTTWLSGCSVPLLTARSLLKTLELSGTLGCFLNPSHAAQIRAALEKIQPIQALLIVVPRLSDLATVLQCDDFSGEIAAGRLFFVAGEDWGDQMGALFEKYPGLPLPQQFLRTLLLDDAEMHEMSGEAQKVISRETTRRAEMAPGIVSAAARATGGILVVAGSRFNLADLSNIALRRTLLGNGSFIAFDPDHPLTASPLALAQVAGSCRAIVAADLFRADLPGTVSLETRWITWITTGRIASPDPQAVGDAVLLADAAWKSDAIKAGWPLDRIRIAGWPQIMPAQPAPPGPPVAAIAADTQTIEIPQKIRDFSSQLLLWEFIEDELQKKPMALDQNVDRYLDVRQKRFNIPGETLDRALFLNRLIRPAYQQGVARLILKHRVRPVLIGRGWSEIREFKAYAMGQPESMDDLARVLAGCHFVIKAFPTDAAVVSALRLRVVSIADIVGANHSSECISGASHPILDRELIDSLI